MRIREGTLQIADKIWFNDAIKCRLRICGFTKEQIAKLENSHYIDITLIQRDGKQEFMISIE